MPRYGFKALHVYLFALFMLCTALYSETYAGLQLPDIEFTFDEETLEISGNVRFVVPSDVDPETLPNYFWRQAYTSISSALEDIEADTYVFVSQGLYLEQVSVTQRVYLFGGFNVNVDPNFETGVDQRDWWNNRTIIQAFTSDLDPFMTAVEIQTPAIFDGFEVRGGKAATVGGGINNNGGYVFNAMVHGCESGYVGGGIYNNAGVVANSLVYECSSTHYGGGIYNNSGTVENCTVVRNTAKYGAGIYAAGQTISVEVDGETISRGYGYVRNVISWANDRADINQNSGSVESSCFHRLQGNTTSIDLDPLFDMLVSGQSVLDAALTLQPGSPCVNAAGTPSYPLAYDITRNSRVIGSLDMGAFEFQGGN